MNIYKLFRYKLRCRHGVEAPRNLVTLICSAGEQDVSIWSIIIYFSPVKIKKKSFPIYLIGKLQLLCVIPDIIYHIQRGNTDILLFLLSQNLK